MREGGGGGGERRGGGEARNETRYLIGSPDEFADIWSQCLLIWLLPVAVQEFSAVYMVM